jgi:hypothetical protein
MLGEVPLSERQREDAARLLKRFADEEDGGFAGFN